MATHRDIAWCVSMVVVIAVGALVAHDMPILGPIQMGLATLSLVWRLRKIHRRGRQL